MKENVAVTRNKYEVIIHALVASNDAVIIEVHVSKVHFN